MSWLKQGIHSVKASHEWHIAAGLGQEVTSLVAQKFDNLPETCSKKRLLTGVYQVKKEKLSGWIHMEPLNQKELSPLPHFCSVTLRCLLFQLCSGKDKKDVEL